MLNFIAQKTKNMIVTMRFSILAIFISLFVIAMVVFVGFTYEKLSSIMTYVAIQLMNRVSATVYNEITNEVRNVEVDTSFAAQLIKDKVVDPKNEWELAAYTYDFMRTETRILPSVQNILWADETGSCIIASRRDSGIFTEIIDRKLTPGIRKYVHRDLSGNISKSGVSSDLLNYDPRLRPWYVSAKAAKQMVVTDVYQFFLAEHNALGVTVAQPIYKPNGALEGVFALDLRLDYIRKFVENIVKEGNADVFILTEDGRVIAFPKVVQFHNASLMNISQIPQPWIVKSYELFKKQQQPEFIFKYDGERFIATYKVMSVGANHWLIGVVVPESVYIGRIQTMSLILVGVGVLILILGLFAISKLVTLLVRPLKNLVKETEKIKHFDIEDETRVQSRIKEIISLSDAIYSMKHGLRSFKKYVPAMLVRQLIEAGQDARIGGTKKQLVIFFSDIKNFTTLSEHEDPDTLMEHVCEYFEELSHIIVSEHGTIDKYIGDSIMAFWGAPLPEKDPCQQAAIAALRCVRRLEELNQKWKAEGKPVYVTRIGIHLGDAIVGNLGSSERLSYTAIGDSINVASRLEGINKKYNTNIIVSDIVYETIKDQFVLRMLDYITLKGKASAHYIYELIAEDKQFVKFDIDAYKLIFAKAFAAYKDKQWDEAIKLFKECLQIYSDDTVARIFIKRCEDFKMTPPERWDGVWHYH